MSPVCVCRTSLIQFLLCANLLFGLLLFRNFSSHEKPDTSDYQPAWYPSSEDVTNSGHVKDQILQERGGGVLSQIRSSLKWGAYRASDMTSEKEGGLCDFKRDEGLPKQVLLQKLVECYKEMIKNSELDHKNIIGNNYTHSNRRLLREITNNYEKNGLVKNVKAAPFHLDYSGPQTHPPKNN